MNFYHGKPEEDVSINLTPLIDVVFLLLIFFMVSTTFDTTSSRELTNSKSATLRAALERAMDGNRLPIVIQSDADSPVQSLVTAMDVVSQLGLKQVSIATTRPIE
jgi:biopolymer transport protein ExbD